MKKVLLIIAPRDFRDEEYFNLKNFFQKEGLETKTLSLKKGTALGVFGGEAEVELTLEEVDLKDFVAVVFIGGPGALKFLDNEDFYLFARKTLDKNITLGAICIAPVILANAMTLKDKKATVWSSPMEKKPVSLLKEKGALYEDKNVVCDGKVITANGPDSTEEFAEAIIKKI